MARITLEDLRTLKVEGNAYDDHDLIQGTYELCEEALMANNVNDAFDAMNIMGIRVMGVDEETWEGFVEGLTWIYHHIDPS